MKTALTLTICAALFAATACDRRDTTRDNTTGTRSTPDNRDLNRTPTDASANRGTTGTTAGTSVDLGTKQVGTYNVRVHQVRRDDNARNIQIELELTPETVAPSKVRGWVGTETSNVDGIDFDKADGNRYRANVKLPETVDANAMLWLEIDGQRTSVQLRR